jgi:hypothetical protein
MTPSEADSFACAQLLRVATGGGSYADWVKIKNQTAPAATRNLTFR